MDSMDLDAVQDTVAAAVAAGAGAGAGAGAAAVAAVAVPTARSPPRRTVAAATRAARRSKPPKKFQCEQCAKSFPSANSLLSHSYTHDGKKPYACTQCKITFSQSCNLRSHILSVHDKVKFLCAECQCNFSSANNLSKHIEKTHNHNKVQCKECGAWMRGDMTRHLKTELHKTMKAKLEEGALRRLQQRSIGETNLLYQLLVLANAQRKALSMEVTKTLAAIRAERCRPLNVPGQGIESCLTKDLRVGAGLTSEPQSTVGPESTAERWQVLTREPESAVGRCTGEAESRSEGLYQLLEAAKLLDAAGLQVM